MGLSGSRRKTCCVTVTSSTPSKVKVTTGWPICLIHVYMTSAMLDRSSGRGGWITLPFVFMAYDGKYFCTHPPASNGSEWTGKSNPFYLLPMVEQVVVHCIAVHQSVYICLINNDKYIEMRVYKECRACIVTLIGNTTTNNNTHPHCFNVGRISHDGLMHHAYHTSTLCVE